MKVSVNVGYWSTSTIVYANCHLRFPFLTMCVRTTGRAYVFPSTSYCSRMFCFCALLNWLTFNTILSLTKLPRNPSDIACLEFAKCCLRCLISAQNCDVAYTLSVIQSLYKCLNIFFYFSDSFLKGSIILNIVIHWNINVFWWNLNWPGCVWNSWKSCILEPAYIGTVCTRCLTSAQFL